MVSGWQSLRDLGFWGFGLRLSHCQRVKIRVLIQGIGVFVVGSCRDP